ncbi:MAG: hypothetical protein J6Z44_02225 [Bacteroidales bacterium]|nr:hypothetical protein [Bacteroidales bacterium]
MKRIFLLFAACLMAFSLSAKKQPYVIVHKSNGGYLAWLNLYDDINYTPSNDETVPATLDCSGAGWSFCRVPHVSMGEFRAISDSRVNIEAANNASTSAINQIIEYSERNSRDGACHGSKSITVSIPSNNRSGDSIFAVKGEWQYNSYGEGDLYIYISPLPLDVRM